LLLLSCAQAGCAQTIAHSNKPATADRGTSHFLLFCVRSSTSAVLGPSAQGSQERARAIAAVTAPEATAAPKGYYCPAAAAAAAAAAPVLELQATLVSVELGHVRDVGLLRLDLVPELGPTGPSHTNTHTHTHTHTHTSHAQHAHTRARALRALRAYLRYTLRLGLKLIPVGLLWGLRQKLLRTLGERPRQDNWSKCHSNARSGLSLICR